MKITWNLLLILLFQLDFFKLTLMNFLVLIELNSKWQSKCKWPNCTDSVTNTSGQLPWFRHVRDTLRNQVALHVTVTAMGPQSNKHVDDRLTWAR